MNINIHIIVTPQCLTSSIALPLDMFQAAHEFARVQRVIPSQSELNIHYIQNSKAHIAKQLTALRIYNALTFSSDPICIFSLLILVLLLDSHGIFIS